MRRANLHHLTGHYPASHRQCRVGHQLLEQAFARSGAQYLDLVSTEGADAFYRSFDHKEFRGFRLYPKPVETVR
jgi:hypothetical protein